MFKLLCNFNELLLLSLKRQLKINLSYEIDNVYSQYWLYK